MKCFDRLKRTEFEAVGKLRIVQLDWLLFTNRKDELCREDGLLWHHLCDVEGCISRGVIMFADETSKAFVLCAKHIAQGLDENIVNPLPPEIISQAGVPKTAAVGA